MKAVSVPVTLKMRMGWDHHSLNAPELARIAEDLGRADDHRPRPHALPDVQGRGRLGVRARRSRTVSSLPVIVNGDICSIEDARQALRQSGADGVMIGRGAYGGRGCSAR